MTHTSNSLSDIKQLSLIFDWPSYNEEIRLKFFFLFQFEGLGYKLPTMQIPITLVYFIGKLYSDPSLRSFCIKTYKAKPLCFT